MTEGEVLVPREPTDEMMRAAYKCYDGAGVSDHSEVWAAMIAAAPPKEAEPWRPDREAVAKLLVEWPADYDLSLEAALPVADAILALPSPPDQKKG